MPENYMKRLKRTADGKCIVTMKYPDSLPIFKLAKREETRKKVNFTFANRCAKDNLPLLKEILLLRKGSPIKRAALVLFN